MMTALHLATGVLPVAAYPTYLVVSAGALIVGVIVIGAYRYWPRRKPAVASATRHDTEIVEPAAERHVRTPSDVLHLIVGVLLVLAGVGIAAGASNTLVGFERDTIAAFDFLPEAVARALYYLFQGFASLVPAAVGLFVLWKRRFRLFGMLILAALIAQSISSFLNDVIAESFGRPELLVAVERPAWLREVASIGVIDSNFISGMVSTVVLGSPWISRPWRRLGWAIVVIAVLFRAAAAQDGPLDIVLAVGAGVVGGSAVLLVFGAPNRRPRGPAVVAAMTRAGIRLRRLERAGVDARSSTPYFGETEDGDALFLKVLGRDERSADLMFRMYRFLRLKDVGDRGPFTSLQRMVEHEALVALYANDSGVLTPRLVVTTNVGDDGFLLAYERTEGDSLDRVEDDALTEDVLRAIWEGVAVLRQRRIAHRDLRLANVMLAPDGRPWFIDFGFAEIAATDQMLDTDVAELLSSTALKVGPTRAVDAAIAVIGKEAVASAAPRIQPLALSTATRKSLTARKPLCDDLRKYAGEASGAGDVEPQDLQRIKPRTVLTFVALALAFYILIPQLADVSGVLQELRHADWSWAAWRAARVGGHLPRRRHRVDGRGAWADPVLQHVRRPARRLVRQPDHAGAPGRHRHQRALPAEAGAGPDRGLVEHRAAAAERPADAHPALVPVPRVGGAQWRGGDRLPAFGPDGADRPDRDPRALRPALPAAAGTRAAEETRAADAAQVRRRDG